MCVCVFVMCVCVCVVMGNRTCIEDALVDDALLWGELPVGGVGARDVRRVPVVLATEVAQHQLSILHSSTMETRGQMRQLHASTQTQIQAQIQTHTRAQTRAHVFFHLNALLRC